MDSTISGFIQDETNNHLQVVILNCIGNNIACTVSEIERFVSKTLLAVQAKRFHKNCRELIIEILRILFKSGAISKAITLNAVEVNSSHLSMCLPGATQEPTARVQIRPNDKLEVNKLGKAAVKSGVGLEDAKIMYKNLTQAQKNFVLTDYLHMLYMVTPNALAETVPPNYQLYHDIVSRRFYFMTIYL